MHRKVFFFRWIFVSSHLPVRFLWAKNKGKPKMMARVALGQNIKIKRYFCFHYFRPTPPGIGSTGNSFFVPVIHKIWEELIRSRKCTDWALYCFFFAVLSGRTFCSVFDFPGQSWASFMACYVSQNIPWTILFPFFFADSNNETFPRKVI